MDSTNELILSELRESLSSICSKDIKALEESIIHHKRVFCDGLGRSGIVMKSFVMRLSQLGIKAIDIGNIITPSFKCGDILIISSASGESKTLEYHAKTAKEVEGTIFLITGNISSPLAETTNNILEIKAPHKYSDLNSFSTVQPMGTLFEQTLFILCDGIVLDLMKKLNVSEKQMRQNHANIE